ncbi:MAG: multicomponent Na+:H+ antiporter subunit B [Myxococcota bacterium]|jgi:multicomponent Na+:H+ antiporter subunit B
MNHVHGSIIRIGAKMLIPYILLLALYVQFHGDYGPGGGFQAGVIFAAGFILYALTHGLRATQKVVPFWVAEKLICFGVLLYAGVGVVSMLMGGNFLEYAVFDHHHPSHGQHTGLLVIELGVGITVFSVMLIIFYNFAGRGRS